MANIARTELIVSSSDTDYQIPGDMTAAQLVSAYSGQIPGLSNMTSTERVEYRENLGNVRIVTFSPRTGTKGAIARTELIVSSSDTDYQIPGDMTAAQLVSAYSGQIPGLSNMTSTERVEYRENLGNVRIVTFSPRTGTKG
jgi:spore coat protein CotH